MQEKKIPSDGCKGEQNWEDFLEEVATELSF